MAKAQKRNTYKRLKSKYRLSVIKEDTFDEKFTYRLSPMNVIVAFGFSFVVLGVAFVSLVVFTPLKEFIPGYTDTLVRAKAIETAVRLDSLENQLRIKSNYVNQLMAILRDEPLELDTSRANQIDKSEFANLDFSTTKEDSLFRAEFEEREKYNVASTSISRSYIDNDKESDYLFPPVRGIVTQKFNMSEGHLGVDVVAPEGETIKAAKEGTVISSSWTNSGGYVIIIQHENNFASVYKHNSTLLKEAGEKVKAGDSIAIIGNTGELSTGPHLHFELWKEGLPIDPEQYIIFE